MTRAKKQISPDTTGHITHFLSAFGEDQAALNSWCATHPARLRQMAYHWPFWRRPDQCPPEGDWRCWLILAGRGFGKTRTGAEWVRSAAEHLPGLRIALVGATLADTRAIMVEGESGLLAIAPAHDRPIFEPSLRRLTWRNGSMATLYSAAEADGLRGPEHHLGWADECAKWDNGEAAWDNLALSLRLGPAPRLVATTTPRPVPLIRRIMDEAGTVMTRGRTADNGLNLATAFLERMTTLYGGTRLGRQELDGVLIEDVAGALWSRAMMEAAACDGPVPDMRRVVVGVDPPPLAIAAMPVALLLLGWAKMAAPGCWPMPAFKAPPPKAGPDVWQTPRGYGLQIE